MKILLGVYGLLVKWGWMKQSVAEVYTSFVRGEIPADGVYVFLQASQVDEFISLHQQVRSVLDGDSDKLPDLVSARLIELFVDNPRRFAVVLNQVDALIERDLEKNIFRRKKKGNVVHREE